MKKYDWMTADQRECYEMLCAMVGGTHHVYHKIYPCGEGIEYNDYHSWATFDFNMLTKAVVLGHDRMIRVEICSSGPRMIKIRFHKRHEREGMMSQRMPTLEDHIDTIRSWS